ncbi:erythromycin biosynthesis sensory transduction protein eryC1 [Lysobacteraceae bacterium NML07-0707]|nr:erythromycin biosynthesis sensory transduction protein eryC1 [Xanthomonadaceae bacterium NML07-0707]
MSDSTIPVNSLQRHITSLKDALISGTSHIIESGHYVLGPHVSRFEHAFADYCGTSECIAVANGTDALELALKAMGVTAADQVAVTANAAMYGTGAVLACAAQPLFVDVNPDDATLDPQSLLQVLSNHKPRAVIVTHLYGRLARIDEITQICRQHGVAIVEDCAQAHGARLHGRVAGSFGDIAAFSFYPTKNLGALGDGGAIVTSNKHAGQRARQLRQYGWSAKYTNSLPGGRNSRLDEIQAQILLTMLPLLDGWNARRRDIANRYSNAISNPRITVPAIAGEEYVGHLYVVRCEQRDALREHLAQRHIQTDIHYPIPDHRQPCHNGAYAGIYLPVTERLAATALTLPCFPELSDSEVERVIEACNQF